MQLDTSKNSGRNRRQANSLRQAEDGVLAWLGNRVFFDIGERLRELSSKGDDLDRLKTVVDLSSPTSRRLSLAQMMQGWAAAVRSCVDVQGADPADDAFAIGRALPKYLIKDRLSFMRFLGLGLADPVSDANTIWTFREALTNAGAIEVLFRRFDQALKMSGYLAMGGQIVDATIVAAPKQRNTNEEKKVIKEGRVPDAWRDKPAKLAQKDRDARWTVKYSKAKPRADGMPRVDLAIPAFGYKNHVSINQLHGLIRNWTATDTARLMTGRAWRDARP